MYLILLIDNTGATIMIRYFLNLQTDINANLRNHNGVNWLDIPQENILGDVVEMDCNARPNSEYESMAVREYMFGLQLGKLLVDKLRGIDTRLSLEQICINNCCSKFVFSFSADSDEIGRSIGQDIVNEVKHIISFELST